MVFSHVGILAIGLINEALDEGDAQKTLQALQIPAAKLEGVLAHVAQHYQDTLIRAKREKAQVSNTSGVPFGPSMPSSSDGDEEAGEGRREGLSVNAFDRHYLGREDMETQTRTLPPRSTCCSTHLGFCLFKLLVKVALQLSS